MSEALPAENQKPQPGGLDWTTCGIVEIAAHNPSVMEYMAHWEGRAEAAEAERDRLQAELAWVQHAYDLEITRPGRFPDCKCNDEDCVACCHYPALVDQAKQRIKERAALTQTDRTGETG